MNIQRSNDIHLFFGLPYPTFFTTALEFAVAVLFITIFLSSLLFLISSTCFPHLGQIKHSLSMDSPQCLQNLVFVDTFDVGAPQ